MGLCATKDEKAPPKAVTPDKQDSASAANSGGGASAGTAGQKTPPVVDKQAQQAQRPLDNTDKVEQVEKASNSYAPSPVPSVGGKHVPHAGSTATSSSLSHTDRSLLTVDEKDKVAYIKKRKGKFKTFKPLQTHAPQRYRLATHAQLTLGTGDLSSAVKLPPGEDINEWLAVNTVDFFNDINMLFGTVSPYCHAEHETCQLMAAGPNFRYLWQDGREYKEPTEVPAPKYIDLLLSWVERKLNDHTLFPVKETDTFPVNFLQEVKVILKRLFRVYAHIYYSHFQKVAELDEHAHLNTSFKHFFYFVQHFNLVSSTEMEPLKVVCDQLTIKDGS